MAKLPTTALVKEIESRLSAHGVPERKEVATWYFPTAMRVIGVPTPELRRVARDVARRVRDASPEEVLRLTHALIRRRAFEVRHAAYEILIRHGAAMASLRVREVERLGAGNDNWASVDLFATRVSGAAWRDGNVTDAAVARWARSKDRWWRRTALVSTVALNLKSRGGSDDSPRTLRICDTLVDDHDDMVVKGMSWALRELSLSDRPAVERFLNRYEDRLARRVTREVRHKLETGLKSGRKQKG